VAFAHTFNSVAAYWPDSCADRVGFVVRVDSESVAMRDVYNRHTDFLALYVVRSGRGIHVIDGVPHGVARGDVYAMAAGTTHAYSQHDDLCLDAIYFRPQALRPEELEGLQATPGFLPMLAGETGGSGKWLHLAPGPYHAVRAQIEELRREWGKGTPDAALMSRALFLRLLVSLCRASVSAVPPGSDRKAEREWAISEAVRYLDEHHSEPVRIDVLAKRLCLSPDRLTELFAAAMGRTPSNYLRHVRIERAQHLLRMTDLTVGEIALRTGFADAAHFCRVFRKVNGLTAGQWRERAPG